MRISAGLVLATPLLLAFAVPTLPLQARALAASYGSEDTGVVNVSNTPGFAEGEEPLTVDPLNPLHLVAVSNTWQATYPGTLAPLPGGNGLMGTAVYVSHDGGRTWKTSRLDRGGLGQVQNPLPPAIGMSPEFADLANVITSDADAVFDRHGNVYFESGCAHGIYHGGDEVASIFHSADGGTTWDPPVTAVSVIQSEHDELDRPWFAVDNSGGARDGTLYLAFETGPFTDDPPKVFVKTSADHGRTWSQTVRVDDGTYQTQFNPRNRPVVDGGGALYIAYDRAPVTNTPFTDQLGAIQLVVARSTDGAATFQRVLADDNVHRVHSPDEALASYSEMIPAVAADQARGGRMAVAWPEAIDASNSRIMIRYTTDGGAHWSPRIDAADDPVSRPNQHDHVALRWLGDGRLVVMWRDRRAAGGAWSDRFQEWARLFAPDAQGGLQPSGHAVEFSNGPQTPTSSYRGATMPDEFQGLAGSADALLATWAQVSGDLTDVVFRSVPLAAFAGPGAGAPGAGVATAAGGQQNPGLPSTFAAAAAGSAWAGMGIVVLCGALRSRRSRASRTLG